MIPSTSFFKNLRDILKPEEWDIVRHAVYAKAGNKCEICGGVGDRHPVECHERWDYDEKTGVQKLVGLIALCPNCHEVIHFGLAQVRGRQDQATAHMRKVTGADHDTAHKAIEKAFKVWRRRSEIQWKLDVSALEALKENYAARMG